MLSSIRRISVLKIWEIFIFEGKQDWIQLDSMFMEMSMALGIGMREVNHETESESWQKHWWELLVKVGKSGEGGQVTEKCKCHPEESEFLLDPSEMSSRSRVIRSYLSEIWHCKTNWKESQSKKNFNHSHVRWGELKLEKRRGVHLWATLKEK